MFQYEICLKTTKQTTGKESKSLGLETFSTGKNSKTSVETQAGLLERGVQQYLLLTSHTDKTRR